jgi:ABC-type bacteriocin/lantibiotic exporter with double-glycine peptidase domain
MGRSHIKPIQQPDDTTCGPAALKHALAIFGKRKSLPALMTLAGTNRNGTSTKNMIRAANKLGFSVLVVEYATLAHLQSALKYSSNQIRAVLVSYLYDLDEKSHPHPDSGHWAVVSAYRPSQNRIVLLDSASAQKKSYAWPDFRERWMDFDLKRRKTSKRGTHFKLIRNWQNQLLFVMARDPKDLPKFRIPTSKVFTPDAVL